MVRYLESGEAVAYFNPILLFNPKEIAESVKKEEKEHRFKKGDKYLLQTAECEGFEVLKKEYEIKGVIEEFNGMPMDSLIMKQVSGAQGTIFSLTKNDCKLLGLEYENGLQIMPMAMNWIPSEVAKEKVKEIKEIEKKFSSRDLSTYPLDYETKTIKHMMVKLCGFKQVGDTPYITTPSGANVHITRLLESLSIVCMRRVRTVSSVLRIGDKVNFRFATPILTHSEKKLTLHNGVFIELDFTHHKDKNGAIPSQFEGLDFSDVFTVAWCE